MISGSIVCSMRQYIKLADRHAFTGRGALLLRKDVSDGESDRRQSQHWLGEGEKSGNFFRSAGGRSWPLADSAISRPRVRYWGHSGRATGRPMTQSGHQRGLLCQLHPRRRPTSIEHLGLWPIEAKIHCEGTAGRCWQPVCLFVFARRLALNK
jgi:hypothetical protein